MPREPRTLTCAECGESFESSASHAKFCGAACRKAANRRPTRKGKQELGESVPVIAAKLEADARRGVVAGVRAELTELGMLDTVEGDIALELGRGIDSLLDGVSAKATAAKQLRDIMAELRRRAGTKADGLAGIEAGAETKLRLVK